MAVPGSGYQLSDFAYQGQGLFAYQGANIPPQVIVVALRNVVWDNPYSNTVDTEGQTGDTE